jgi:hypothetical protein
LQVRLNASLHYGSLPSHGKGSGNLIETALKRIG